MNGAIRMNFKNSIRHLAKKFLNVRWQKYLQLLNGPANIEYIKVTGYVKKGIIIKKMINIINLTGIGIL
jgi:DNA polymerase II small subunit/DNA polymerase delta subunit B